MFNLKKLLIDYYDLLKTERLRIFCNINVAQDVSLQILEESYSVIVDCSGMRKSKSLSIPGESLRQIYTSDRWVKWYNGVNDNYEFVMNPKNIKNITIIGLGNVALDVARLILHKASWKNASSSYFEFVSKLEPAYVGIVGRNDPFSVI